MCGRFTLSANAQRLQEFFPLFGTPEIQPRFNIAPTQSVLAVRQEENAQMASKKSNKNKAAELEGQPVVAETSPTETPVPEPAAKKLGETRVPGTPKAAKANPTVRE